MLFTLRNGGITVYENPQLYQTNMRDYQDNLQLF